MNPRLVQGIALRGRQVIVDDIFSMERARTTKVVESELMRRARACIANFGDEPDDMTVVTPWEPSK